MLEVNGLNAISAAISKFFDEMKKPRLQSRGVARLPSFLEPLFEFMSFGASESLRRLNNPEKNPADEKAMQAIFDAQNKFKPIIFAMDFFKSILGSLVGPKVMNKISPLFNGILNMVDGQAKKAIDQEIATGRMKPELLKKYKNSQKEGRKISEEGVSKIFNGISNYTKAHRDNKPILPQFNSRKAPKVKYYPRAKSKFSAPKFRMGR